MKNFQKYKLNPDLQQIQIQRATIKNLIREFFKKKNFLEAETPILVKYAGMEPYLSPFSLKFKDEKNKTYQGFLITSPEYSLKKMLAAGFEKLFEITKAFRQEESFGPLHNPEFSILEWYRTKANYKDIMKDTEELIFFLTKQLYNKNYFYYQNLKIDVSLPFKRMSLRQVFKKYARIDLEKTSSLNYFKKVMKAKGYKLEKGMDKNDLFYLIFLNEIEPNLDKTKPIFLYDYPIYQGALAKKKKNKPFYVERFELFIGGMEIANAFSELLDYKEQLKRLKEEQKLRKKMKREFIEIDKDFIKALKSGIKPTGGIALGVDRLEMLLLNIKDINDLLMFPARDLFL
ncbi:MAG TPA: EF-P lysine aminoacylase EpmA [Candidatus Paceibacterota bacterium]|mgnify:FL=1|nr:EF-P lysine aminoacylase EpmA [Candidatus Paceibacterota bacterium]HPP64646.1 EF-P lysine aminoacylase EpmA [Candidatus Paceibacterota bacterium]